MRSSIQKKIPITRRYLFNMKDPAALFYFNDWMGGTATLSRHLKGCYMDLLCVQFNSGKLSLDEIKTVLGSDFGSSWPTLQKKFTVVDGLYFNERLMLEKNKRNKFSESRRANAKHMPKHMEDINENRNINYIFYGEFQNVQLTEVEYTMLISKIGKPRTEFLIEELSGYIKSKGKDKYKDHYATIQNWARRKIVEHVEKKLLTKTRTIANL